jgi:hypothetical protein
MDNYFSIVTYQTHCDEIKVHNYFEIDMNIKEVKWLSFSNLLKA